MPFKSRALEVNLASYHVEVSIDPRYFPLQEAMSRYYGLMESVNVFLTELSHPYKNWKFIVQECRKYALDYFYIFQKHARGPEVVGLIIDVFLSAVAEATPDVRADAVDNLMLFLQKTVKDAGPDLPRFFSVLEASFERIRLLPEDHFELFVRSFYAIKRLAELCFGVSPPPSTFSALSLLLHRYHEFTYAYWLSQDDPMAWFETEAETLHLPVFDEIFSEISHQKISGFKKKLDNLLTTESVESITLLENLLVLPAYGQIVETYKNLPMILWKSSDNITRRNHWKVIFLFHIMNISGLSLIHEDALREINRTLSWLIGNESHRNIMRLIQKTFSILKARTREFPVTALNCALNMGKGVYKTDESDLVNFFIDSVIDLGFQTPMIGGVGSDWQIQANSAHIQNIRAWMTLIELNPKWSTRLLSCLIIHLCMEGVFIKDTDLFPRDITRLLNSDIGPVYNLVKQLARIFPSFFNDIGAEGELREISTRLDEMAQRKDVLIHFLRKQSHVESSNQILGFIDAVLDFWKTGDKAGLASFVPLDIHKQIETSGPYIDGVKRIMTMLRQQGISLPVQLLTLSDEALKGILTNISGESQADIDRIQLMAAFYKLLHHKYHLDFIEISHYLDQLKASGFPDLNRLKKALEQPNLRKKTALLIDYLEFLKELILSSETYEIREDIYKKRHITVDIPSMYGSYHEMKFDALGLTFRIESLVNVLFEELVQTIDLSLITHVTIHEISELLTLFDRALKVDGIHSVEFERQQEFLSHSLEVRGFTFTQYLDIFKGFSLAVKNIIHDYFNNVHEENLNRIIAGINRDQILPRFLPQDSAMDSEKITHWITEIFFRDQLVFSLGLQQLDQLLSRILNILFHQLSTLHPDQLRLLLLYDPTQTITTIDQRAKHLPGIIYIGNKGLNLVKLKRFGLQVPPGFIITTEAFRCREIIEHYPPALENFRYQITRHISALEKMTGKTFGNTTNPLLFSVRSGASISQPGMMDTLLNVGINEGIAEGLALKTGNAWFAWDNYRRFLQCYGMAVGLERDHFDAIISKYKRAHGIPLKRGFTGAQMQTVALAYKKSIAVAGFPILDDPMDQLYMTINSVFDSWESDKAKTYRKIMGISDDWGTAVTVQAMVFGNISRQSGTGVIFTHNPRWSGDRVRLWGDFTIGNQGEDVVSGLVNTMPISIFQQEVEMRDTDVTLETHFPEIYAALKNTAIDLIEKKGWTPQEMEFTFESAASKDLFILQTRDMAMRERKKVLAFDPEDISSDRFLGHGIGVSGGAMAGRVVFTVEEIEQWRLKEPETFLILVRGDTVPDDIREIFAADGLLTARGGLTSHAAVVAHRLGKTCVVGCGNLICREKEKQCEFNQRLLFSGDAISIDGLEGSVYQGLIRIRETS
ncbi:MAG: pyruvate, phosphate dikinase [Deltaproteobacteria bacterium]|nr:pyruvate, phosphate dikinase [Deltaproteobacteria bacterium]